VLHVPHAVCCLGIYSTPRSDPARAAAATAGTKALRVTLWRGGRAVAILFHTRSERAIRHTAMARIEKTVFISYRRTDESWALAVFENLTQHGYDVFIDYDGIASGSFATVILENIKARAHFLVLLTPTALERCRDPKDWMRREIEAALDSQRNIVPLMLAGFDFGTPASASQLTGKLAALKEYNGISLPAGFFQEAMGRLRNKFLSVSLDTVLHPASDSAQQVAKEQKDKATMAALHQPWPSPEERAEMQRDLKRGRDKTPDEATAREARVQRPAATKGGAPQLKFTKRSLMIAISSTVAATIVGITLYQATLYTRQTTPAPANQLVPSVTGWPFTIKSDTEATGDLGFVKDDVRSVRECAQGCDQLTTCNVFSYNESSRTCYLYSHAFRFSPNVNYVSGTRN
jgi:hypothetical protein